MTDKYIRKQDVVNEINANADDLEQNGGIPYAQGARAMAIVVEQMSPADVVPVVRCKDCNYHLFDAESGRWWGNLTSGVKKVNHDDFCSEGKRKET